MADTCDWKGASGALYTYHIYPNPPNFSANQDGNYIYAKKNAEGKWVPVYFGEGDLSDRCTDGHHKSRCISNKGATNVHAHLNATEKARKAEEADLLANYTQAYTPTGCNDKLGG